MRSGEVTFNETLVTEDCISCGVMFAMPKSFKDALLRSKRTFYCPNGHDMQYRGESHEAEVKRLQREAQAERDRALLAERELTEAKAEARRQAKRSAAGVCSCCHRTFQNVARHMQTQHPEAVTAAKVPKTPVPKRR